MRVIKLLVLIGSLICTQPAIGEVVSSEQASAVDTSAQESISQKNNQKNKDTTFWFEEIKGDHTVYWQFIEVYDKVKESLEKVARRLSIYLADHRIGKAISAGGDCFNYT